MECWHDHVGTQWVSIVTNSVDDSSTGYYGLNENRRSKSVRKNGKTARQINRFSKSFRIYDNIVGLLLVL